MWMIRTLYCKRNNEENSKKYITAISPLEPIVLGKSSLLLSLYFSYEIKSWSKIIVPGLP